MNSSLKQASEARYVLAFDTANEVISVAIGALHEKDKRVEQLAEQQVEAHRASNTQLLPTIDALLNEQGIAREEIACVVCGRGPGSFTGVRICIATAKGVASALEVPLVGVSTLDALAWELQVAGVRGRVLVVADAMRKEVYPQVYEITDAAIGRMGADTVVSVESFGVDGEALGALREADDESDTPFASAAPLLEDSDSNFVESESSSCAALLHAFKEITAQSNRNSVQTDAAGVPDSSPASKPPSEASPSALEQPSSGRVQTDAAGVSDSSCVSISNPFALITGDALTKYADVFAVLGPLAPEGTWRVRGNGLLLALQDAWRRGECDPFDAVRHDPALLLPVYTRLSDAEEHEREKLAASDPRNLRTGVQTDATGASTSSITYRPLAAADIDQVAALEALCMGTDAWNASQFADELGRKDRTWWVVCDNQGMAIAYAGGQVLDGQLQVFKVACSPTERRQGIAQELLARIASDARDLGAGEVTLEVRAANEDAQAFYHALGLHDVGVRPRYYSDGEDALIMAGPLPVAQSDVAGMELRSAVQNSASQNSSCVSLLHASKEIALQSGKNDVQTVASIPSDAFASTCSNPRILAIESSCDETAAAVVEGSGAIVADTVASQIDFHARFGGVVPEIASRKHIEAICGVAQVCLEQAGGLHYRDLDAIACTYAPGLVGALVVGVAFAKGVAWGANIPYIQVNHLEGHLYANKFEHPDIAPPMVVSLVSGGHTMLVHVRDWGDYEILGSTIDDAVGEAFDKVAKALGLGYPGGPIISRYAEQGNPQAIDFPRAMLHSHDLQFSLSGLKTAVITYIKQQQTSDNTLNIPDIAASFQAAVIDVQVAKAKTALEQTGVKEFCLGGGVAANPALRAAYEKMCSQLGVRLTLPPASACTDNAAMIALVALDRFSQEKFAPLDADAYAHANLEEPY